MHEWLIIRLREIKSKCKVETAGKSPVEVRVLLRFSLSYKYSTLIQHNINVVNWSDDGEY